MKVIPYIETIGSKKFKTFLLQPFDVNMLYVMSKESINLFSGWRGKDMGNYMKFTNEEDIILEFYSNTYIIIFPKRTTQQILPIPNTINDFINDMHRNNIQLYWNDISLNTFEPKEFLSEYDTEKYYTDLLGKLNKSHELI